MLKSEFVEMGGKEEDYSAANNIYMTNDLWLDKNEFFLWWSEFGREEYAYSELQQAVRIARKVSADAPGLYKARETMLRFAFTEVEKAKQEIACIEQRLNRLKAIKYKLLENVDLYNR